MTAFQKGVNVKRFIWAWSKEIDTLFFRLLKKKHQKLVFTALGFATFF